jgi:hypothetical protein
MNPRSNRSQSRGRIAQQAVIPAKAGIQETPVREKHAAVHILDSRLRGNDGEEREQVVNGYFPYTSSSLYNAVNGYPKEDRSGLE